jgi:hypothetical protein
MVEGTQGRWSLIGQLELYPTSAVMLLSCTNAPGQCGCSQIWHQPQVGRRVATPVLTDAKSAGRWSERLKHAGRHCSLFQTKVAHRPAESTLKGATGCLHSRTKCLEVPRPAGFHPRRTCREWRLSIMAPTRRNKFLECFYCGRRSSMRYHGQRSFECASCDATNYLDEVKPTPDCLSRGFYKLTPS